MDKISIFGIILGLAAILLGQVMEAAAWVRYCNLPPF